MSTVASASPRRGRRAIWNAALVIFLSAASCQSEAPTPKVGATGAAGGASAGAAGGGSAAAGGSAGPVSVSGAGGLRAGLQADGSITYVRNK